MKTSRSSAIEAVAQPLTIRLRRIRCEWWIALAVALLHVAVAGRYDIFRNELYAVICGRHPDFGYVDMPPLIPLIAGATQLCGENVWLLRLPAVIAAAALVVLAASFARLLGGKERSAWIAGAATGMAPALAALTSVLSKTSLEPIGWTAAAFCLTRAILKQNGASNALGRSNRGNLHGGEIWDWHLDHCPGDRRGIDQHEVDSGLAALLAVSSHCCSIRSTEFDLAATAWLAISRGQCPSSRCRDQFYGYPSPLRIRANSRHESHAGAALDHGW